MKNKIVIFIDATPDLQPEREAAEYTLHRLRESGYSHIEILSVQPDQTKETCLQILKGSQIYVGLFGQVYGPIVDEETGHSLSEALYQQARSINLPRLIYLQDSTVPSPPKHLQNDPHFNHKLNALKQILLQERFVYTFSETSDLCTRLAMEMPRLLQSEEAISSKPTPTTSSKYQVNIGVGKGTVIGDHNVVIQNYGKESTPSRPSPLVRYSVDQEPLPDDERWLELGDQHYFVQEPLAVQSGDVNNTIYRGKAWHKEVKRNVLLWHIKPNRNNRQSRRFLQEIENKLGDLDAAAQKCIHLPKVYTPHPSEDSLWVVMEWINGVPLNQSYPPGDVKPGKSMIYEILNHGLDICDAIAAIHNYDLAHLSIKPANILYVSSERGAALVNMNFTHSKQTSSQSTDFLAPEQTSRKPAAVRPGTASDIYSLGATLYFLLTHQIPSRQPNQRPKLPSDINSNIHPLLDDALLKALVFHPRNRFSHVRDLRKALLTVRQEMR